MLELRFLLLVSSSFSCRCKLSCPLKTKRFFLNKPTREHHAVNTMRDRMSFMFSSSQTLDFVKDRSQHLQVVSVVDRVVVSSPGPWKKTFQAFLQGAAVGVEVPRAISFALCRLFSRSLTFALKASFSRFTASNSVRCRAASSYLAWARAALELGLLVMATYEGTEVGSTVDDTELR